MTQDTERKEGDELTLEQVVERYSSVPLKFSSYYKYTFYFVGIAPDGARISAMYGGNSDDIYRYDIDVDELRTLGQSPKALWMGVSIHKDDKQIFDWWEYS